MADFYTGAADQHKGPDNPSSDYSAMRPYWDMVEAINGGAENSTANDLQYRRAAGRAVVSALRKDTAKRPVQRTGRAFWIDAAPYTGNRTLKCVKADRRKRSAERAGPVFQAEKGQPLLLE